jgi:hypothetical protein
MKTLNTLLVVPQFDSAGGVTGARMTCYLDVTDDAGIVSRLTVPCHSSQLLPGVQQRLGLVVQHLQTRRAGTERIVRVSGELTAPAPATTHTEQRTNVDPETGQSVTSDVVVVDTYRPVVSLSLTITTEEGGARTIAVSSEALPPNHRDRLLTLWDDLATVSRQIRKTGGAI